MPWTNRKAWFTPCVRIVKWATICYKNHDIIILEIHRNREFYRTHDVRPPFTYASLIRQVGAYLGFATRILSNYFFECTSFLVYTRIFRCAGNDRQLCNLFKLDTHIRYIPRKMFSSFKGIIRNKRKNYNFFLKNIWLKISL